MFEAFGQVKAGAGRDCGNQLSIRLDLLVAMAFVASE